MPEFPLKSRPAQPDEGASKRASKPGRKAQGEQLSRGSAPDQAEGPVASERYRLADLIVDAGAGVVTRRGKTLALSPLTFDLLLALIRHAPQPVRRQQLLEAVWPNEFVNDDSVWQRVRLLRDALGDTSEEPRYVTSVRGWGYKLVAEVERLESQPGPIRALAVLPLANLSGDPQQEYFADGMTETLITALAKIRSLKVISRTSVMHYKHADTPLPQIARELGVDAVVEGTALAVGGRVRVSVQLIRAANDEHLWAEMYDRELEDVFALHADLAKSIAAAIEAAITPEEHEQLVTYSRVNPAAHESDLRGRYFLGKFTPRDVDRAIGHFEQAISQDTRLADAYAGLAHACFERAVPLGTDLSAGRARELLSRGKSAAQGALGINATLAEALAALSMILLFLDWNWQGSEQALENAFKFGPGTWLSHGFCAVLASTVLDAERTVSEMRRAIELDPLNLMLRAEAGECCFWVRDYKQAEQYASQTLELDGSFPRAHFVLGRVREAQGRIAEAIREYKKAGVITTGVEAARRALRQGGPAGYHRWALGASILGMPGGGSVAERPWFAARIYARLGEADNAMRCLGQAYEQRDCLLVLLKALEWWDPLRADPRFNDLVRRVGIP